MKHWLFLKLMFGITFDSAMFPSRNISHNIDKTDEPVIIRLPEGRDGAVRATFYSILGWQLHCYLVSVNNLLTMPSRTPINGHADLPLYDTDKFQDNGSEMSGRHSPRPLPRWSSVLGSRAIKVYLPLHCQGWVTRSRTITWIMPPRVRTSLMISSSKTTRLTDSSLNLTTLIWYSTKRRWGHYRHPAAAAFPSLTAARWLLW